MHTYYILHTYIHLCNMYIYIIGAVHRYYESRRRIGIEELPERQGKAAEQKKRRKHRARQQRVRNVILKYDSVLFMYLFSHMIVVKGLYVNLR